MPLKFYNDEIVENPTHIISVVDDFTYNPVSLIFTYDPENGADARIRVTDLNGVEYFKSKDNVILYDNSNKAIFKLSQKFTCTKVYIGTDKTRTLAKIKYDGSYTYKVEYYNQKTESDEVIFLYCDKHYCSGAIFQGKEGEKGSVIIGKIVELMDANSFVINAETKFLLNIAPNVDNALIISLAMYFINKNKIHRCNKEEQ